MDIEHVIAIYFDDEQSLEGRINRISTVTQDITSKSSKRIALYHIMKLRNKRARIAAKTKASGSVPNALSEQAS